MNHTTTIKLIRKELQKRCSKLRCKPAGRVLSAERGKGRLAAYQSVIKMLPKLVRKWTKKTLPNGLAKEPEFTNSTAD